jgi:hypothetical protein
MASFDEIMAGFDASTIEPLGSYEPLPEGWYKVIITDSEKKKAKTNGGEYLELTLKVTEGEHAGRLVWDRLNVKHHSDKAVKFAFAKLSSICRAVGVMRPRDTAELHNIEFCAYIKQRENPTTGNVTNEVEKYSAI